MVRMCVSDVMRVSLFACNKGKGIMGKWIYDVVGGVIGCRFVDLAGKVQQQEWDALNQIKRRVRQEISTVGGLLAFCFTCLAFAHHLVIFLLSACGKWNAGEGAKTGKSDR